MDGLANRFVQLQGLQESLLKQIREFKESGDPAKLPDIVEANKLDDELQDLARELDAPSDPSPSNTRRRRSQVNHQFTFVAAPESIKPEPSLFPITEQRQSSANSSRRSSLTLPVSTSQPASSRRSSIQPSQPALATPSLSQNPPQTTSRETLSVRSSPKSTTTPSDLPKPVSMDLLSPSSRERRRQIDSFYIQEEPVLPEHMPDQPDPVADQISEQSDSLSGQVPDEVPDQSDSSSAAVPEKPEPTFQPISVPPVAVPSFGEFMKSFVQPPSEQSSELSFSEINEGPTEVLEEAPPVTRSPRRSTIGANLNYQIPQRTVYQPEMLTTSTPKPEPTESVVDQVKDAFSGIVESLSQPVPPTAPTPPTPPARRPVASPVPALPVRSPLHDSNRRRSAFGKSADSTEAKFWETVHQQRIKAEKIGETVTIITTLLDAFKTESKKIRVRKFGILGEYLFKHQHEFLERGGKPAQAVPDDSPSRVVAAPSMFDTVRAVLLIQRYFRRFVKRRRDRIEAVKSLATTEANDARDKLRKRRLERKAVREDSPIN